MQNKKGNAAVMAIIIILVAITVSVITWLFSTRQQTVKPSASVVKPGVQAPVTANQPSPTPNPTASDWQIYRNERLGFELQVPVNVDGGPIKEIENGNIVWIVEENGPDYKDNLRQIQSSVSEFQKVQGILWAILVKPINNDKELDQLIKDRYGKDCKLGEKSLSSPEGIYDVSIDTSSADPDNGTGCFLNWIILIKYSPDKKIAAVWDMGQDVGFVNSAKQDAYGNPEMYDQKMIDSFHFIK